MKIRNGYTLVESLMVIVIIAVIAGMAAIILSAGMRGYFAAKPVISMADKANVAMTQVMRELHGAQSISALGATSVTFVNQLGESVVINVSGTTLQRNVGGGGAEPLCTDVSSLTLGYYDQALAVTAVPASVRYITLAFTLSQGTYIYSLMSGTLIHYLAKVT